MLLVGYYITHNQSHGNVFAQTSVVIKMLHTIPNMPFLKEDVNKIYTSRKNM